MNATAAALAPVNLVAFRYNHLNVSIHRITPQADGMELVEYISRDHPGRAAAMTLLEQAEAMAKCTGAVSVTQVDDRSACGGRVVSLEFHASQYRAPRRSPGLHKAPPTASPEQAALASRVTSQSTVWAKGDRVVVGILSNYVLPQNRRHDHRDCPCDPSVTTYREGTVSRVAYWADNSIEAYVDLDGGGTHKVTLVAPHGDACF